MLKQPAIMHSRLPTQVDALRFAVSSSLSCLDRDQASLRGRVGHV